jgi:hypothetical protein
MRPTTVLAATRSPSDTRTAPLVLVPETVDEVEAETVERPLNGDEFLEALDRLSAAASQQIG